jgi:hypothetical protein
MRLLASVAEAGVYEVLCSNSAAGLAGVYGILFAWRQREANVPGYHPTRIGWVVGTREYPLIVVTTFSESRGLGFMVKEINPVGT